MTLHEAWEILRGDPSNPEALVVLLTGLEQYSHGRRVVAAHRDDAVSKAKANLLSRVRGGDLPQLVPAQVGAYLQRTVVNASIDLLRKEERQKLIVAKAEAAAREKLRVELAREVPDTAWPTLEEVFAKAMTMRDAWHRPGLQRAWEQVRRLHFESVTLREILGEENPSWLQDAGEMDAAIERAYKAHTRLRGALVEATHALKRAGKVIEPDAVLQVIGRLRRRQPKSTVQKPAKPASSSTWSPHDT